MAKDAPLPHFNSPLVETHFHLDYLKERPAEEILAEGRARGVERFITISVEPDNFDSALDLAIAHPDVYCTRGVHPHEARKVDDESRARLIQGLSHPKVVAVGEIGLDYHYDHSPRDIQKKIFEEQLQLAVDYDLSVVVHSREAEDDTMAIIKNFLPKLSGRIVIHSFTSALVLARFAIDNNLFLGFNGIITFKSAENVREALRLCSPTQVVLETDAPFLTPVPFRGRENAPGYLPYVAQKMSQEMGLAPELLLPQVYDNSRRLFPKAFA
jgi:TatD DNase family protein